jgi:hypothetical protein
LINFVADVVAAWAFYLLLKPVNASLSLLTAWLRLVYTIISVVALLNLVMAFHLLNTPDYLTLMGSDPLHAQLKLLLSSFRTGWSIAFIFFGFHLIALGCLVYRSGYIPKLLGVLLAIAGVGYVLYHVGPYLLPKANLEFLFVTFFGELFFMLWLLIRGATVSVPPRHA